MATGVYESYNRRSADASPRSAPSTPASSSSPRRATTDEVRREAPQYGGITAPGNAPWVLTVGASSHMGTIDRADDTIAAFSSRGPTAIDRAAKPDLVAPGVGIESLSVPNSTLYNTMSAYLLPGTSRPRIRRISA